MTDHGYDGHGNYVAPLQVHVVKDDTPPKPPHPDYEKPRKKRRLAVATRTVVLTSANPVQSLVNHEPNRHEIRLIALDNPIVVCDSYGQATDQTNLVTGIPNPNGAYIPVTTNTIPVLGTDPLWVVAATYPSRVTVFIYSYADA